MKTKAQEGTHCRLLLRNLQARLQEMLEHLWWKETQLGTNNLHFKPSSSTVLCLGKKRQNFKLWEIQHTNTRCSPPLPYPKLMNIRRARKALHSKTVACISLFQERHFNSFFAVTFFLFKWEAVTASGCGSHVTGGCSGTAHAEDTPGYCRWYWTCPLVIPWPAGKPVFLHLPQGAHR